MQTRQTATLLQNQQRATLESPITLSPLTACLLSVGRSLSMMQRIWKLYTEKSWRDWFEPRAILLWGNSANHSTTMLPIIINYTKQISGKSVYVSSVWKKRKRKEKNDWIFESTLSVSVLKILYWLGTYLSISSMMLCCTCVYVSQCPVKM